MSPAEPMNIDSLRLRLSGLSVYRGVVEQPLPAAFLRLVLTPCPDRYALAAAFAGVFAACAGAGCTENAAAEMEKAVLRDDNPYTRLLAAGKTPPESLERAALMDMAALKELALLDPLQLLAALSPEAAADAPSLPLWQPGEPGPLFSLADDESRRAFLSDYHRRQGCGIYTAYAAFLWEGGMTPIAHADPIRLEDLKGYELPRQKVIENTENFLKGYPASNMLLYGDRGTGKSSTVHAILNRYRSEGLRMLELPKEGLRELPRISEALGNLPLKFIVFIDDLSFDQADDSFGALKAVLEGSLSARPDNLLLYATSNRRHLVRENHSDRQGDEVHAADTMQEQLSLSDRFGITVTFLNPGRAQFYEILDGMAADRKLDIAPDALHAAAERWALSRGGRSPRVARQFMDFAQSRLLRGLPLD